MPEGCHASPYMGNEPFAFVACSGKDQNEAFTLIERLASEGYRICFAQPDGQGTEEAARRIGERLGACAALIALYSSEAAADHHFRKVVTTAVLNGKPVLPVFLEEVELSCGMRLQCPADVRTNWYAMTDALLPLRDHPAMKPILGRPHPEIRTEVRKPGLRSGAAQPEKPKRHWPVSVILVDEEEILREKRMETGAPDGLKEAGRAADVYRRSPAASGPSQTVLIEEDEAEENDAPGLKRGTHGTVILDEVPPVCIWLDTGECRTGRCGVTRIGRDESCDICIPEETVSFRHLELTSLCQANHAFKNTIRDCRSSNGSWVNGERLESGAAVSVGDQASVDLGRNVHLFVAFGEAAQALAARSTLACLEYTRTGERHAVGEKRIMLGRNDPFGNGFFDDMRISWEHAQLWYAHGEYLIQDQSSNGTSINGTRMEKYSTARLRDGTEIVMGRRRYIFRLLPLIRKDNGREGDAPNGGAP